MADHLMEQPNEGQAQAASEQELSDTELIAKVDEMLTEVRYHEAARRLKQVQDSSLWQEKHRICLVTVERLDKLILDLSSLEAKEDGWKKQAEGHRKYDTSIHYKVDDKFRLTARFEFILPSTMLPFLIAVWNESDLFATWMPSWKYPIRLGVRSSTKLVELGRGHQVIQVVADIPPPFSTRDVVQHVVAADAIEEMSKILILIESPEPGDFGGAVPEPEANVVRMFFDGAIMIQACQVNHPLLVKSKIQYPPNEGRLLITMKILVDPYITAVPHSLLNFVTRNVLSTILAQLLRVTEEVRDGTRTQHIEAIKNKPELYDWVKERCRALTGEIQNSS